MGDDEFLLKEGNFVDGEGEIMYCKKGEKIRKYKTILKYNQEKKLSEGLLIEEGNQYFVEFKDGKEIRNSRQKKYEGARIMIVGVQSVGKTTLKRKLVGMNENNFQNFISVRKEEHMTHGVEISRWKDTQGKLYSLWDFAGILSFFLSFFYFSFFKRS